MGRTEKKLAKLTINNLTSDDLEWLLKIADSVGYLLDNTEDEEAVDDLKSAYYAGGL